METIGQRIRRLREGHFSQRALAKKAGLHNATMWKIEDDEMPLISDHLFAISQALNVSPLEILGLSDSSNLQPIRDGSRAVPILPPKYAARYGLGDFLPRLSDITEYENVLTTGEYSAMAFAMRIRGDSMKPDFQEDDIVIIDPKETACPGDFVAAKDGSGNAIFLRYKSLGTDNSGNPLFELVPLNSFYPSISSAVDGVELLGVMVEHRKFRKSK